MSVKLFNVNIELDIQAVTCPGVWLCPNGNVVLKVYIFGSIAKTSTLKPIFPLLYHQKFIFTKTLNSVHNLADVQYVLSKELLYAELIQYCGCQGTVLATFETSLLQLLYPSPCLRKGLIAGVDVNLLMEPTRCFPGILAPKIEVSTKTTIEELTSFPPSERNPGFINPKVLSSKRFSSPERLSKCGKSQKSKRNICSLKTQSCNSQRHYISNICKCKHCYLSDTESCQLSSKDDTLHKNLSEIKCVCSSSEEKF
ncbi:hypothetical protein L9F63_018969, partial [Diploptera punctata]